MPRSPKDLTATDIEWLLLGRRLLRPRRRFLLALLALIPASAAFAEPITCQNEPSSGRWVYRVIDGSKCWFRAGRGIRRGRDLDKRLLRWEHVGSPDNPSQEPGTSVAPVANDSVADGPGSFRDRWDGLGP